LKNILFTTHCVFTNKKKRKQRHRGYFRLYLQTGKLNLENNISYIKGVEVSFIYDMERFYHMDSRHTKRVE
jgi:hypothetical protein